MKNLVVLPGELASDYMNLNPRWHKGLDARFDKPKSGTLRAKEVDLSKLVENDPNNVYMDLRELTRGYKVRGKRKRFGVVDPVGNVKYNGNHDGVEGVFRPEPLEDNHIQKNPTIAEKAMIAFIDGDEVYILSEGGSRLMIRDPSGKEVALYGAPFDEVHPFDMIIPIYRISFKPTDFRIYAHGATHVGAAKLVLGRKGDKWMLNNVFGETFAEIDDKETLLHIIVATREEHGDGLEFYALDPASTK